MFCVLIRIASSKEITLNYSKSAAKDFFQGTQERVRNSCGKRAISVRATEVLLYIAQLFSHAFIGLAVQSTVSLKSLVKSLVMDSLTTRKQTSTFCLQMFKKC